MAITVCPDCKHYDGWKVRVRGCGATTDWGPCNSDYKYCGCHNEIHNRNRCSEYKDAQVKNSQSIGYHTESVRCIDRTHNQFTDKCKDHLNPLLLAKANLAHEEHMAEYSRKRKELLLGFEIDNAKKLLENNGYKVSK